MKGARGFSLLELIAVLAIFALVAVIGVQVIQASVRSSTRLTEISEDSRELALAMALIRQDLNAALARSFVPAGGGEDPALLMEPGGFSLSVGGLARVGGGPVSGFGRVQWRYDAGNERLSRQVWTSLTPGDRRAVSPEVTVLTNVRGLELDSFDLPGGWRAGFAADPRDLAKLPLGLRVRIDHGRIEGLETWVSLR